MVCAKIELKIQNLAHVVVVFLLKIVARAMKLR